MPPRTGLRPVPTVLRVETITAPELDRICDVILMAALAEGFLADPEIHQISRTIAGYREFESIPPEVIALRADVLVEEAPLFPETRTRVVQELTDPRLRRLALSFAAKVVSDRSPLKEEQRALLFSMAEIFQISEEEREHLFLPWRQPQTTRMCTGYTRCSFNDPGEVGERSLWGEMSIAQGDQFKMLTHKVRAIRSAIDKLCDGATISALGEALPVGPYAFRADAILRFGDRHFVCRFLSESEELYPVEHTLLPMLEDRLELDVAIVIGYSGCLAPADEAFLRRVDPMRIRPEILEF